MPDMKKFLLGMIATFIALSASASDLTCVGFGGRVHTDIPPFGGLRPTTPIQEMANLMLEYAPRTGPFDVQVAIPVVLESTLEQGEQFGDGQRNALATYGGFSQAPFVATLKRLNAQDRVTELSIILRKAFPGLKEITDVEVSVLGVSQILMLGANGELRLPVDVASLNWNQLYDAKSVFFRPVGWNDWFAIQFPYAYVSNDALVAGMHPAFRTLPGGKSIIDPLGLANSNDGQNDLRKIEEAKNLGFVLARTERSVGVHAVYVLPDGSKVTLATGGVWTRYRLGEPFKIIYLAKDGRVVDLEEEKGVVSGMGPHYIGAKAEIIVNSLGSESLMTFYGAPASSNVPNGGKVAWGLSHQWIGSWLRPGQAFVTPQGMFHWHLNHLQRPVAAQVFTPPSMPTSDNHFGFPKDDGK